MFRQSYCVDYGKLPYSAYVLWQFNTEDSLAKKQWLAALTERLTRANAGDDRGRARCAPRSAGTRFTGGIAAGPQSIWHSPPADCGNSLENMHSTGSQPNLSKGWRLRRMIRQRSRGALMSWEISEDSPQCWDWGGWEKEREIDGLLLLFAVDEPSLRELSRFETQKWRGVAGQFHRPQGRFHFNDGFKEHFGFKRRHFAASDRGSSVSKEAGAIPTRCRHAYPS